MTHEDGISGASLWNSVLLLPIIGEWEEGQIGDGAAISNKCHKKLLMNSMYEFRLLAAEVRNKNTQTPRVSYGTEATRYEDNYLR